MTVVFTNGRLGRLDKGSRRIGKIKSGPLTMGYITLALICMVCVFYLFEIISIQAAGYDIKALDNEIIKLTDEQKELKIKVAESRRLGGSADKKEIKQLNMVPLGQISFISSGSSVASSR